MHLELEKLRSIEEKVQICLKKGEYTFIGPVDRESFESFIKNATTIAPAGRTIHEGLSNKEVISKALLAVNSDLPLRIYVVNSSAPNFLSFDTIEGYCELNKKRN